MADSCNREVEILLDEIRLLSNLLKAASGSERDDDKKFFSSDCGLRKALFAIDSKLLKVKYLTLGIT